MALGKDRSCDCPSTVLAVAQCDTECNKAFPGLFYKQLARWMSHTLECAKHVYQNNAQKLGF